MDSWLKMFSPLLNVRMPAAGDVQMDYSPWTNWGWYSPRAGDPQMEDAIYRHVASLESNWGGSSTRFRR